jgi:hypothetical protein
MIGQHGDVLAETIDASHARAMTHADAGRQRRGQAQRPLSMRGPTGTLATSAS